MDDEAEAQAEMEPPMAYAITNAKTKTSGARTAMRMMSMNACWTLVTSVVRRVTSDELENWSMLLKENVWIL